MNCQISSFLNQKVNTQLVLMFLAQNITVEILIKIFISLMHKYWYPYSWFLFSALILLQLSITTNWPSEEDNQIIMMI